MSARADHPYRSAGNGQILLPTELEIVLAEECRTLIFDEFDQDIALEVGMSIYTAFKEDARYHQGRKAGIALCVTLFSGVTLYQVAVGPGVSADNMEWLKRKAKTVQRFGVSSWLRGQSRLAKGKPADDSLLGPDYAAHGGSFPIFVKNVSVGPIGAITVSGMTQELDHEIVVKAIKRWVKVA